MRIFLFRFGKSVFITTSTPKQATRNIFNRLLIHNAIKDYNPHRTSDREFVGPSLLIDTIIFVTETVAGISVCTSGQKVDE